jgi:hypothetical protein
VDGRTDEGEVRAIGAGMIGQTASAAAEPGRADDDPADRRRRRRAVKAGGSGDQRPKYGDSLPISDDPAVRAKSRDLGNR